MSGSNCGWSSQRDHSRPRRSQPVLAEGTVADADEDTRANNEPLGLVEADDEISVILLKRGQVETVNISWRELCFHLCEQ